MVRHTNWVDSLHGVSYTYDARPWTKCKRGGEHNVSRSLVRGSPQSAMTAQKTYSSLTGMAGVDNLIDWSKETTVRGMHMFKGAVFWLPL
jgi:hypothetical protein